MADGTNMKEGVRNRRTIAAAVPGCASKRNGSRTSLPDAVFTAFWVANTAWSKRMAGSNRTRTRPIIARRL